MTTARRFPKVSDAVDPQLESALRGKLRNFWNEPERGTDPIADASIVAEKVSKSSCFGAVVGVLAIIGALAAVFGSRNEPLCICLEREGDNGDCPIHGKGHK